MIRSKKYLLKKSKDIIMDRGEGVYLYDNKGRRYLDLTATAWTMNLGYGNKKINKAILEQVKKLPHCRTHYYTVPKLNLAKKLSKISPIKNGKIDFCLHGSAANEGAMKLSLNYKVGSGTILYLEDGFHGRTFGTMSITWKHQNKKFKSFYGKAIECKKSIRDIELKIKKYNPSAIIIELIQGNGGMHPLPIKLVRGIRELCNKFHVTMIVDEIQTAFGRCGCIFLSNDYKVIPDIITFGKAMGGGMPLFGTISKSKYKYETDDHSFTFAHFPPAMAASLAYLKQLTPNLLNKVLDKGEYIKNKFKELQKQYKIIGSIKGVGLMLGVEIVDLKGTPSVQLAEFIVQKMLEHRVIMNLDKCSGLGYTLKYKPALTISYKQIDCSFKILEHTLKELYTAYYKRKI